MFILGLVVSALGGWILGSAEVKSKSDKLLLLAGFLCAFGGAFTAGLYFN